MKKDLDLYNLLCRTCTCCDAELREVYTGHVFTDDEIKEQREELYKRKIAEIVFRNNKLTIDIF